MSFLKKLFGLNANRKQSALEAQSLALLQEAQDRSRQLSEQALRPREDDEQARSAGEARLRRLQKAFGIGSTNLTERGAPTTALKTLMGE